MAELGTGSAPQGRGLARVVQRLGRLVDALEPFAHPRSVGTPGRSTIRSLIFRGSLVPYCAHSLPRSTSSERVAFSC